MRTVVLLSCLLSGLASVAELRLEVEKLHEQQSGAVGFGFYIRLSVVVADLPACLS
jgi:hypothetical protein